MPYAMGKVKEAEPMPLWIIPNKKVTLQDVQACMRDHYEGTPFALDSDIGGGVADALSSYAIEFQGGR